MEYLYKDLEQIINALHFAGVRNNNTNPDIIDRLFSEVAATKGRLRDAFIRSCDDAAMLKFTVLHHESLVRMQDSVLQLISIKILDNKAGQRGLDEASGNHFLVAYKELSDLSDFFHQHFGKYIPVWEVIPGVLWKPLAHEVKGYLEKLRQYLAKEPSERLTAHLLEPFINFTQPERASTWHDIFYCRELYQEFIKWVEDEPLQDTGELIWILYSLNHNSAGFYRYFTNYISENESGEYLKHLYFFQKKTRQTYVKPGIAYKREGRALPEMVDNWLKEEINYLEKTQEYKLIENQAAVEPQLTVADSKILYNFSVAEFAYYKKVKAETNIIKIGNRKEFCEKLARTYRTKNIETISSESLRSKFYKSETAVKSAVKDGIIRMLNYINADLVIT